ncbi:hypothetical protein MPTK1_3g20500 [Marchantia polymorpha subsp. ruderalis]|uniref:AAA+ ATPase domain-containing protein n=2 Tax=Marchantia polymorpha TaxID=3197 RepID=A0A176W588_MARPO|nr:hypothetical protein AXG93_2520s1210 [Marchantia polymorpha subsp. ruderalis]PTQ29018.1 hypothetical protein MARPO_0149s0015 [Marchantia polymorpha]BBN06363.1 hypothetical protein Mp_3g20500 [Marchantia polymorpha subsp. ruderalis]|eukprot:PTQ29018.1 hypothetical protein MARPO_0149s0015 [Marchantia polymorpha]
MAENNEGGVCTTKGDLILRAEDVVAGMAGPLEALRELVLWPLLYSQEAACLGLKWPRGLLLHGPPGTGKTSLVHAVAKECGAHLTSLSAGTLHRSYAGESERLMRDAFAEAALQAVSGKPAIIFIDEIDALCPRRDSRRQQETRIVAQLLTLMDGISSKSKSSAHVVVVASTNRVNAIDPALRRPGRFDRELAIAPPNSEERYDILCLHGRKLPLDAEVDLRSIASKCNGYVGADLQALCREAAMSALTKGFKEGVDSQTKLIGLAEWEEALLNVGPSIVRGTAAAEVPKVSWADIGGLFDVKKKLKQAVEWPIRHADAFARLGIRPVRGVLLHGPPGCCKTTLARAAAHAAQATMISLSGAELYSMYVGEGEALLRDTFRQGRLAAPSIIFFDEVDSVASRRQEGSKTQGGGDGTTVAEKLLSTLLTEIDGLELAQGVLVLAATNRPQMIDAALMRPGRFDSVIYVPPPDFEGRLEVLKIHTRKLKIDSDVSLHKIAMETENYTGAELAGLCREAAMVALRESLDADTVYVRHFDIAKASVKPSLTALQIASYASFDTKGKPVLH